MIGPYLGPMVTQAAIIYGIYSLIKKRRDKQDKPPEPQPEPLPDKKEKASIDDKAFDLIEGGDSKDMFPPDAIGIAEDIKTTLPKLRDTSFQLENTEGMTKDQAELHTLGGLLKNYKDDGTMENLEKEFIDTGNEDALAKMTDFLGKEDG